MSEPIEATKEFTLIITLKEDGKLDVKGPILQKPICLWMLEIAKDLIKTAKPPEKKIIQPKGGMLNFARNKK